MEAGLGRGGGAAVGGGGAVFEGEELDSVVGGVAVVVVLEGSEARGSMPVLYLPWLRNMVKLKLISFVQVEASRIMNSQLESCWTLVATQTRIVLISSTYLLTTQTLEYPKTHSR